MPETHTPVAPTDGATPLSFPPAHLRLDSGEAAATAHGSCLETLALHLRQLRKRSSLYAIVRLVVFVGLALGVAETIALTDIVHGGMVLVGVCVWVYLTMRHRLVDEQIWQAEQQVIYHQRGLERIAGSWQHGQEDGSAYIEKGHPFAHDLDLIGDHGLYACVNSCSSDAGRAQLADMMFNDNPRYPALAQASYVQALMPETQRRGAFWASLQLQSRHADGAADKQLHASVHQMGEDMPAALSPLASFWIHSARAFFIACVIGGFFLIGIAWLFTGFFIIAAIASVVNDRACVGSLGAVDCDRARLFYQAQLRAIEALESWADIGDSGLQEQVHKVIAQRPLVRRIRAVWDGLAQRRNPLWRYGMGSILLADWWYRQRLVALLADDPHAGERVAQQLGECDALSALSAYAAEQGGAWVTDVSDDTQLISCSDLQHPLLARDIRVGNDISLKHNQVLLLSGANASGKSTFLRSLSLAVLMARMGLPVCAAACAMKPQRLATLMRVHDDVQAGLSRFQAEVKQLRHVLDRSSSVGDPVILILDEILAGTNSEERRLGTKAILDHLQGYQGLIVITTHDLELTALADDQPERIYCAHFADQAVLEGVQSDVQFDYKLRAGVLHSTNALRVMRAAGLPV